MDNAPLSENPYASGAAGALPNRCFIQDAKNIVLPQRCIVCDSPVAGLHSYLQEHIPLIIPPIAIFRRTQVVLPYCAIHANQFHSRFRTLRIVQGTMVAVVFAAGIAAAVAEKQADAPQDLSTILISVSAITLCLLPITVVVRRFLYDAFFRHSGGGVKVSSGYAVFIQRLREANGLAAGAPGSLPHDTAGTVRAGDPGVSVEFIKTTSPTNQLAARGALLPAAMIFIQAIIGIWTALTVADPSLRDATAMAIALVLNGLAAVVAWFVLRSAKEGRAGGWNCGHWLVFLTAGYALGVAIALMTLFGPQPGRPVRVAPPLNKLGL